MTHDHLKTFIDSAYEHAVEITPETKGVVRDAVEEVLDLLDKGELRVAEKRDGHWAVHQWLKKAILLSFRLNEPHKIDGGPAGIGSGLQPGIGIGGASGVTGTENGVGAPDLSFHVDPALRASVQERVFADVEDAHIGRVASDLPVDEVRVRASVAGYEQRLSALHLIGAR